MFKNKKFNLIVLILTVITITVFSGCVQKQRKEPIIKKNHQKQKTNNNDNQKQQKIIASSVEQIIPPAKTDCQDELDVSCWNIYRNNKYEFEIKYPKNWKLYKRKYTNKKYIDISLNSPQNEKVLNRIKTNKMYGEGYMDDIIIHYYNSILEEPENSKGATTIPEMIKTNPLIENVSQTKLANEDAWQVIRTGFNSYYSILLEHNGHLYEILFGNKAKESELTKIDKNILSTFKFLK